MTRRHTSLLSCVLLTAAALAGFHGCDTPSSPPYDRAAMLRETAEVVILPGYEAVEADAAILATQTRALCGAPSLGTLSGARDAWRVTFLDWERTGAYQFGPTRDMNYGPEMAFWPTRPATIEANLAAADPITASWIDTLGAGGKGVFAIEYLLFAPEDNAMVLAALTDTRRCDYLVALADHVARTSSAIVLAWSPAGGDYVGILATAGEPGNETYLAQLSAVSTVITQVLNQLEATKLAKLGVPLGHSDGAPQPDSIESPYGHASVEAMLANLEGAHAVWATTPHSFDGYLRSRRPDLADTILAQFDASRAALETVPEPFDTYVLGTDHIAGDAAYERLSELIRTIANEASNALAVSVMFNPNDGD